MRYLLPALLLSTTLVAAQRPRPVAPRPAQRAAPQRAAPQRAAPQRAKARTAKPASIPVSTRGRQTWKRTKSETIRKGQERARRRATSTTAAKERQGRTRPSMSGCGVQSRRRTPLTAAQQQARSFQRSVTDGRAVKKGVARLRSLVWHKKLKSAYASARRHNKPVLWIQALGSLTGYA